MSGKFTQRGEINILPYYKRVIIAKKYGVSKVAKLNFEETVQAAHIFAKNAVLKLYNKFKIDKLVFGSESNNPDEMFKIANTLKDNSEEYYKLIRNFQKKLKISFPKASSLALKELTGESIEMPNDILGLEYIKTIVNNSLPIKVFTIERNIDFHSETTKDNFASASLIRKMLFERKNVKNFTPIKIEKITNKNYSVYKNFKKNILKIHKEILSKIPVISEGMENLLIKKSDINNYDLFIDECTSKRYTSSRIKRAVA